MKKGLLTAVSLVLAISSPALAQSDRETSAGAAKPVKLGGDERNPQRQAQPQRTLPQTPSDVVKTSDTQASNNDPARAGQEVRPKSKGLIPPPPPGTTIGKDAGDVVSAKKKKKKAPATAEATKDITVASATYRLTGGKSEEQFTTLFNWQPDDPKDPITFTAKFSPLGGGGSNFNWLRIMMGGKMLYNERTLQGKTSVIMDMTGQVPNGTNQMLIQAQGGTGATLEWKLTTPIKVKLTSVNPDEVVVGGDLTLKGSNFDTSPAKDIVTIGSKTVSVSAATSTELKLKIPKNFTPGETTVKVAVNGLESKPLKINIRGIPELTGTNFNGVPPGAELTVFGKNFSKKLGENQVFFGETPGAVVSGTTEQLVVVVPNFSAGLGGIAGQVGIPIKVKVGKIESSNTVPVTIGNSIWEDPGLNFGPNVPQVPVDWRRLLEN
ncbi:MAG: IPT/TIG domain-containing protein [Candidatus Obscuribacterales bacterium]|nr:IPT/TIG domain-containing protein [Candidatus Obscuribacterales bacterium]